MFAYNRRFITENDTRDDYINLNLRLSSQTDGWKRAIDIMRGRIIGRYMDPIETLIRSDVNKNGFAAMALCCLLIETLLQFREGLPQTPGGENQQYYARFLKEQLGHVFNNQSAKRFYKDIRCGILHSAQTKNGSCLTFDTDYIVKIQGNGIMMVNIQGIHFELAQYFEHYCEELIDPSNVDIRTNFIKKMDDITKKRDGSNEIDNIWFAICAKEGIEIERLNGRTFTFRVVYDGENTFLRIGNNIYISKEDIDDALYYWPNERAIRMLDKSVYILPILQLCKNIADEFIRRQIA